MIESQKCRACETPYYQPALLVAGYCKSCADKTLVSLKAENARLKDTNRRLNRRCQGAEAAAGEFADWKKCASEQRTGRYFPALMAHANVKFSEENTRLAGENEAMALQIKRVRQVGYEDGVRAYAHWKDGVQYVGTCGKTLKQALGDQA